MSLSKAERFAEFLRRLAAAPPAGTGEEALELLMSTLNAVEDAHSGVPFDPRNWRADGRMYPPEPDSARPVPGRPDLIRYRSRAHNTVIGADGSIEFLTLRGESLLRKPGSGTAPP